MSWPRLKDLSPEEREIVREKRRIYNLEYKEKKRERIRNRAKQFAIEHRDELHEKRHREYIANKEAHKKRNREQYLKHRDKRLAYAREYLKKNSEHIKKMSRKRYRDNHDEIRAKCRENYKLNSEKIKAAAKEYRDRNKDKVLAAARRRSKTLAGRITHHAACIRRRARLADNANIACDKGIHWRTVAARQGSMLCAVCGKECVCTEDRRGSLYPTVDHIIPISKGGTHTWSNVRLLCRGCNTSKYNKLS